MPHTHRVKQRAREKTEERQRDKVYQAARSQRLAEAAAEQARRAAELARAEQVVPGLKLMSSITALAQQLLLHRAHLKVRPESNCNTLHPNIQHLTPHL
eukprot:scaffold343107_cov36-Prasinocladus_malaysianus.AAC.1